MTASPHEQHTELTLTPAPPFDVDATFTAHGWVQLAPNSWDRERRVVGRVQRLSTSPGRVVCLAIRSGGTVEAPRIDVNVQHAGPLSAGERTEIDATVGHMFRVDEDLSEFHAICRARGEPWCELAAGKGRLIRSPTLFEDVVKVLLTTNIQWSGTRRMCAELVQAFGAPCEVDGQARAFPTPQAIAAVSPDEFAQRVRLGYRAVYVHSLTQRIASGELDLEAWRNGALSTAELQERLRGIKGVGPYAAAHLLMLLGRYDEIGVDTEFRSFITRRMGGQYPGDRAARAAYDPWGRWRFLAYWFDRWDEKH